MNNLIGDILRSIRGGANPMQTIMKAAANNPSLKQASSILQGKDARQLEMTARNMCKERGVNPDDLLKQMGLK